MVYEHSILMAAGFCVSLAIMGGLIGWRVREQSHWLLLGLCALLEAFYCVNFWHYYTRTTNAEALASIQVMSGYMCLLTYIFGQVTMRLLGLRDIALRRFQAVILLACLIFSAFCLSDFTWGTHLAFTGVVDTDLASLHRQRVNFTALGQAWLLFVNVAFYTFAYYLFRAYFQGRREILPVIVGIVLYFMTITNDFNLVFGLYDFYFLQHFGFTAVVLGFSLVYAQNYFRNFSALQQALAELEKHRDSLVEAAKLKALGEIAGCIAHEINNPLTVLMHTTTGIRDRLGRPELDVPQLTTMAEKIERTSQRMSLIVRGLQGFSRNGDGDALVTVPIRKVIDETLAFCLPKFRDHMCRVIVDDIPDYLALTCQPTQISQVLVNFLNNALDATEALEDRWVRISVIDLGSALELRVMDSGPGIPPDVRTRILEPFFTTKKAGKGTGLGLSISKRIIEQHDGVLSIDTTTPHTCFVVTIPKARTQLPGATASPWPESAV